MGSCTLKESLSAINTTNAMCGVPIKDRSSQLIITNAVFGGLAFVALLVRIQVSIQQHIFGLDDFSAIVAYIFAAPVTFGQLVCGLLGFGKDTWAVSPEYIYMIMKIVYFNQLSYFISSAFSKLCFLFMFLRIFPAQRTRKFVYAGIVLSVIFPIAFGLPMTFACKPISAVWTSWDMETPYDHCINQSIFWFVAAAYNIAVDVYIVLIPIPELIKLNLSLRKKLMLVAIFSTGVITIVVSIARLWALAQYGSSTNPIYDNVLSGIFSPLELNVGIICMCMPAFRRFVARYLPHCFGSTSGSSDAKYKYREYDDGTPNARISSGKRSGGRGGRTTDTLGGSLFQTTIMKTVDTRVEETRSEDDEVRLMELKKNGQAPTGNESMEEVSVKPESLYKAQHKDTLPKEW